MINNKENMSFEMESTIDGIKEMIRDERYADDKNYNIKVLPYLEGLKTEIVKYGIDEDEREFLYKFFKAISLLRDIKTRKPKKEEYVGIGRQRRLIRTY